MAEHPEIPEAAVEAVYTHSPGSGPSWQGLSPAAKREWRDAVQAALPAIHADLRERLLRPGEDALGQLRRIGEGRDFSVSDSERLADRLNAALDVSGLRTEAGRKPASHFAHNFEESDQWPS